MPILPLLAAPTTYRPCIQNLLADGEEIREYWLDLFVEHCDTLAQLSVDGGHFSEHPSWSAFREDYLEGLAALRATPSLRGELTVLELTRYREEQFEAHGFPDPFLDLKHRENEIAIGLLPDLLAEIDATDTADRIELLVRGLFAGNLFDMGSKATIGMFQNGDFQFRTTRDRIRPRPWAVDGLDRWLDRLADSTKPYRQALVFVDNAGPDILLGIIPFIRELSNHGIRIVLAANSEPALNDITAKELRVLLDTCAGMDQRLAQQLEDDRIVVVASGCGFPLIDLRDLTQECCEAAKESDLLILEGMGRAIESNYDATFTVDTIKVALTKEQAVADAIGVTLFDPIFRFEHGEIPESQGNP